LKIRIKDWAMVSAIGVFYCCFMSMLLSLIHFPSIDLFQTESGETIADAMSSGFTIIIPVLFAPIVEELLFRKFFYGGLRKKLSPLFAALLVSIVFAMMHLNTAQMVYAFCFSLILCELAERTANWYVCAVTHLLANGFSALVNNVEPIKNFFETYAIYCVIFSCIGLISMMILFINNHKEN